MLVPAKGYKAHTIWPNDCANQAENKVTADMINSVDPNFLTSKHPNCAVEGEVFFLGLRCSRRNKPNSRIENFNSSYRQRDSSQCAMEVGRIGRFAIR